MKIAPSCVNENFCVHKKPYTVMAKSVVNQALGNPFWMLHIDEKLSNIKYIESH